MNPPILAIDQLSAGYGGRPVLKALSLEVARGQRLALIGPNGCGKSTLLRAVTGEIPERTGLIRHEGDDISGMETADIICRGIGYLRQTHNIFTGLTVLENLEIAASNGQKRKRRDLDAVLAAFPVLRNRMQARAGLLSGGERQALAAAMILMHHVSLLLLDEPLAGLSPKSATELLQGIDRLQQEEGFAIILVEHRLKLIQPYLDRVLVMVRGAIAEDSPDVSILTDRKALERHFLT